MSNQPFERQVAAELAKAPGLWVYHPSDAGAVKQPVPADFIYGHELGWGLLEVKSTRLPSLGMGHWPPDQQLVARHCVASGGRYYLAVRFQGRGDILFEPAGEPLPLRFDDRRGMAFQLTQLPEILLT